MLERIKLVRNVGQFDSVATGVQIPLLRLALIYAANGRGKTTLSAILRSLRGGDPVSVIERKRLAAAHPPHIVLTLTGSGDVMFQSGAWSKTVPDIAVFDDRFVSENVCSGVDVEPGHRQSLHDLILGSQGVELSKKVQGFVSAIEEHNRLLRAKADAIPADVRGRLSVDEFCAVPSISNIDKAIEEAELSIAAANSEEAIRHQAAFEALTLPSFDVPAIEAVLERDLPALDVEAAARLQAHLAKLGKGGEAWVSDGVSRIASVSNRQQNEVCPFCSQALQSSHLVSLYRAYFSAQYAELKEAIARQLSAITAAHSGEAIAAFERFVRVSIERRQFWISFTAVAEINLDTAEVARARKAALVSVTEALQAKQATPLERSALSNDAKRRIATYDEFRRQLAELSGSILAANPAIALIKEKAATANLATLTAGLAYLKIVHARYSPEVAPLCDSYLAAKAEKTSTENARDEARKELEDYRKTVFPTYEVAINKYLGRLNAGFALKRVDSANTRGGSSCTYFILINNVEVPITVADAVPSFRNTLSAGDRNTLALAFFFASLDLDPGLKQKIVIMDDPMTSLDEHRSRATIQEMRRLVAAVDQVIVMSHSKPFLCGVWEGADKNIRSAMKIVRDGTGSELTSWDIEQDNITEHDRRHALVRNYMQTSNAADERAVAAALRPVMESFVRVAYPEHFPPGSLLGPFFRKCRDSEGTPQQIMAPADTDEFRDLLDYANKFHHDTNPAWETATINDSELNYYCKRTVIFTRRTTPAFAAAAP